VGDLGELWTVQRAIRDHAEDPAGREELAHLGRTAPQALERALVAVAELAHRAAHAGPAVAGRPGVGDLQRGHRRALEVGEHHRAAHRVGEVEPFHHVGGQFERHGQRPGRAVGELAAPGQRGEVRAAEEAGQRRVRAGEQQLEVGQLGRPRRIARSVT
jgi:hypothetical protein